MQLKTLEVFGFKSFANRTRFDFGSGVTVIVGPNGCGKSNVVDSLKWVLGEQSAKSLRGSEMMDVIFNGSQARKPVGFAEVSLTFSGCQGTIHPELDEICITRKLFRNGESEYLINRNLSRLKDIRELFMDTGVGMKAYSIIEQGRIDALLHASNVERRGIFDEAAGISRYKSRKKDAQRRLERAEQNLIIIDSTLDQVGKRLHSLKVQAGKARRYREYGEELRKFKIAQSLHRFHSFNQETIRISGDLVMAENTRDAHAADLSKIDAELVELKDNLQEHETGFREASEMLGRLEEQIDSSEKRKTGIRNHLEDLGRAEIRLQSRRADCLEKIEKGRATLVQAKSDWEEIKAQKEAVSARLSESEAALASIAAGIEGLDSASSELKSEGLDNERLSASERSVIREIEQRLGTVGRDRAGKEAMWAQVSERHAEGARIYEEKTCQKEELDSQISGIKKELQAVYENEKALEEEQSRIEARLSDLSTRKIKVNSRREFIQKYYDRLEGVSEGPARLMRERIESEGAMPGVLGLLADLFKVQPRHVKAVEAALGVMAEAVVVADFEAALESVEFLKEGDKGRCTLVPKGTLSASGGKPESSQYRFPGVIGRAADLVECAPEDRGLAEFFLGATLIVESLDVAVGLKDLLGAEWSLATLDGELAWAGGPFTGGVALKGRLAHVAEMKELDEEHTRLEREALDAAGAKDALATELGEVKGRAKALNHEVWNLSHELIDCAREAKRAKESTETLAVEKGVLEADLAFLKAEHDRNEADLSAASARLSALETRLAEIKAALDSLQARLREEEEKRAKATAANHELDVEFKVIVEREANKRRDAERVEAEILTLENEYRDSVTSIEENAATRDSLRDDLAGLEEEMLGAAEKLTGVRAETSHLSEVCDGIRQELSQREAESRTLKNLLDDLTEQVNGLKLKENEFKIRLDEVVSRALDEFGVVLSELYVDFDDSGCDWDQIDAQVKDLKEKIDRLGQVNMEAIRECEEEEGRFEYLSNQKADLVGAKEQLLTVIRRIDKRSRELFVKTFEDVKENFKVLFRKLFGGGKADIILEDENDLLESGIEIIAQPKDKKPSSISLLSGGEKVMTCIALTFAIFMAKPSPFCILDEVDAALDESNIDRFVNMLNDFVQGSQFIIISHNKKTMMVGDAIFGVTMQEPGVSKKVSLRIEEAGEMVDGNAPRREDWKTIQDRAVKQPEDETASSAPAPAETPSPETAAEAPPDAPPAENGGEPVAVSAEGDPESA